LAVILDVVYNHVGEQNNLLRMDPDYFFRRGDDGNLQNFSGCGNDLRTESPMVQRLIIDSLVHMIKTYNVDGFRFDLAELLGLEFLYKLERELRLVRQDIQIIHEPWSFHGNMRDGLRHLSGSAWNDEYRDFLAEYVHGRGNFDGMCYFLNGSLGHRSAFPQQSVNYIESHDDGCWIDKITENRCRNGMNPTDSDRRRTHLALAILMMSIGVPMVHAGQDMLQSKRGMGNTYQLGDVNALDYGSMKKNWRTGKFFRQCAAFRSSKRGGALRPASRPSEGYVRFFRDPHSSAVGVLYNADHSLPSRRIFFAANPHTRGCSIELDGLNLATFRQLSDGEKFFRIPRKLEGKMAGEAMVLQPLGLILCIE
jgi:pullulanase/glycogen debranching enzyme